MKTRLPLYSLILFLWCGTTGCELIRLGGTRRVQPDISQNTAQGAVLLFKAEIDSNNIPAATRMIISENQPMLAVQRYELQDEVARLGRSIARKSVTQMLIDTISERKQKIRTEFNYLTELTFTTIRVEDRWFITSIVEHSAPNRHIP